MQHNNHLNQGELSTSGILYECYFLQIRRGGDHGSGGVHDAWVGGCFVDLKPVTPRGVSGWVPRQITKTSYSKWSKWVGVQEKMITSYSTWALVG